LIVTIQSIVIIKVSNDALQAAIPGLANRKNQGWLPARIEYGGTWLGLETLSKFYPSYEIFWPTFPANPNTLSLSWLRAEIKTFY
jgi:hypothetical protein